MKPTTRKNRVILILLSGLLLLSLLALHYRWLIRADFYLFDRQVSALASKSSSDNDIVIVAIDDFSLDAMKNLAGRWVWPRTVHAELIEGIQPYQPKAIAFDILFAEKDIYRPDADDYFNEVLSEYSNVYFSALVLAADSKQGYLLPQLTEQLPLVVNQEFKHDTRAELLLPLAIKQENWRLGTINYHAELDGVGRYYDVYQQGSGWKIASLASVLALDDIRQMPTQASILLNWRGDATAPYKSYSYSDVYRAIIENNHDFLQQFSGKTVLIGATAAGLYDARITPINHNLPGVYMLATALDNIKHQAYFRELSQQSHMAITCGLIVLVGSCFYYIRQYSYQLVMVCLIVVISWISAGLLTEQLMQQQLVLFIASPLLLMSASACGFALLFGYLEFVQRRQALSMFGRFLDPKVVLNLLSQGKLEADFLNQKTQLTILFSDIRGFTSLSEQYSAQQVLALLNQYFSRQVAVIFATKGTLDKFIGDCLMAFWGAPISSDSQAVDAIDAALTMQENLLAFKQTLPPHLQHFDIGIGIHSGEAIAGLVGTKQRVDYTVIGDAVNVASRIEGLTKNSCRILVSEQTMLLAQHAYCFEEQGEFNVKGRQASVKLFQPLRR